MSYRRDKNRKSRRGQTPDQLRRAYPAHELACQDAISTGPAPGAISPAGYLRGIELFITEWPGTAQESGFALAGEDQEPAP